MRPATGSSGSSSPSQRTRLRASRSVRVRVAEAGEDLLGLDRVVVARAWLGTAPRAGSTGVGRERADVRAHVERAGGVVADVAQQPPAARRPARAVVEREHERARADPRGAEDALAACAASGSGWRPPSAASGPIVERSVSVSRWTAPGRCPASYASPRAHVDEDDAHSAPRGVTSSAEHGVVGEALGQLPAPCTRGRRTRRSRSAPSRRASRPRSRRRQSRRASRRARLDGR